MSDEELQPILSHELAALHTLLPWKEVDEGLLAGVLPRAELCFFARGAVILHADLEPPACLVVRDGRVDLFDADRREGRPLLQLPAGAPLPLLSGPDTRLAYVAAEDLYCWRIAAPDWTLLRDLPTVLRWQLDRAAELLGALQGQHRDDERAGNAALAMMALPVGSLSLPSFSVTPNAWLSEAAALMRDHQTDALAVIAPGAPPGVLTETELLRRMATPQRDHATAVGELMTPATHTIAASCTVADAAQTLCARGLRHLPVTDDAGAFAGLLSADALFRLQRGGFGYFASPIERARDLDALAEAVADMRAFAARLCRDGSGPAPLTAVISALNDQVVRRVIQLTPGFDAGIGYCWLAFGSEGRHEQTLATDQDNGILFAAPDGDPQALRDRLLEFAELVNTGLDRCGFPLCKGNIMARNPRWCLSLDEWRDQFSSWIRAPGPEALLNANIFFDFTPVHGDSTLADALSRHLFSLSRDNTIFLAMMAENALRVGPPLGAFGRFATDGGEHAGTIDLKRQGSRLFVDAARVFALAHGIRATHTGERLRLGGMRLRREARVVAADVDAFNVVLGIRMGSQLRRAPADARDPNRVDPHALNDIDQRVLRAALHQAQHLQERLKLEYGA